MPLSFWARLWTPRSGKTPSPALLYAQLNLAPVSALRDPRPSAVLIDGSRERKLPSTAVRVDAPSSSLGAIATNFSLQRTKFMNLIQQKLWMTPVLKENYTFKLPYSRKAQNSRKPIRIENKLRKRSKEFDTQPKNCHTRDSIEHLIVLKTAKNDAQSLLKNQLRKRRKIKG